MTRILLVEDDEMSRDMLSRRLQRRGYSVITACDGRQGYSLARSETPELILMNVEMPEMDGWEVTRLLKASANTRSIPIIVLTAHALVTDRANAFKVGCDDYDTKPVEFRRSVKRLNTSSWTRRSHERQFRQASHCR
jgi:two-component system, cell cycle response regulator DivK